MPDGNDTSTQGQAPAGGQGQAPIPPAAPQGGDPAGQAPAGNASRFTSEEAERIIGELRKEQAANRKRLQEFEAAQKAADDARLSETQKLQRDLQSAHDRIATLEVEQQSYYLTREIARHAAALNLVDPEAAALMLNAGGEIKLDADGHPANVQQLLEALVAAKPYLVAQGANGQRPMTPPPPSSGGATNPGRGAATAPPAPKVDPKEVYKARRGLADHSLWKR